jgi:hypothetical protein
MTIRDKVRIDIECIDGVRTEDRTPVREVTLTHADVPDLPALVEWRDKRFTPDTVTIRYRPSRGNVDKLGFEEVTISGTTIRKDGKPGTGRTGCGHWMRPEGLDEDRLDRIGEYIVPAWLLPYIDKYDPIDGEFPFSAKEEVPA